MIEIDVTVDIEPIEIDVAVDLVPPSGGITLPINAADVNIAGTAFPTVQDLAEAVDNNEEIETTRRLIDFTGTILLDILATVYNRFHLTEDTTPTTPSESRVDMSCAGIEFAGNGVNNLILTNYINDGDLTFDNTNGMINNMLFAAKGTKNYYRIIEQYLIQSLDTPTGFTATANGQTQIDLTWTDVANESSYLLEVSDDGSTGWTTLDSPVAGSTSYSHTGLTTGTTKYYRLKAIGDGIDYLDSGYATANTTTAGLTQLSTPTLTATANGETQIDLSWTNVANESSYLIEVSDTGTDGWATLTSPAADATAYSHTGLTAGTTKYYRITAIGDGSTYSNSGYGSANATTDAVADLSEYIEWINVVNGTYDSGTKILTATAANCKASDGNVVFNKVDGNYIEFDFGTLGGSAVLALVSVLPIAYTDISTKHAIFSNSALIYSILNGASTSSGIAKTDNQILRLEYNSGNILYRYSTNAGTSFTTFRSEICAADTLYIATQIVNSGSAMKNSRKLNIL